MNGNHLQAIPTIDELIGDPAKAAMVTPETAQALLIGLASIQPLLIQRALAGPQPEQREPTSKTALLDAKQVAERLNVPKSFVYEAARQGKLKPVKLGEKYVRFTQGTVDEYLTKSGA